MTDWDKYIESGAATPEWPYPIRYDEVSEHSADVLIVGGGIAGCHAAINAAREGARVILLEKGNAKRSGNGGHGVDHWNGAPTNPCSKVAPTEWTERIVDFAEGFINGPAHFIAAKESWDALLDCEQMGVQIRDIKDEFKGARFRDDETKLMFAYDYVNRINIRVWGHNMKPSLQKEMKRLGVEIFDRVMMTSLLNEGGVKGARIVGATGVNVRTGEFYIFTAGATVITTAQPSRNWNFVPEQAGGGGDLLHLNLSGDGHAAGWNAGAEFVGMESTAAFGSGMGYLPYGVGNADNSWHGASIVDAKGKEVPWADMSGRPLKTFEERFHPGPGEKYVIGSGVGVDSCPGSPTARPMGMGQGVLNSEYTLPFYADLPGMPELERRVIFGMMVANEGKTRIPVYDKLTKAGFDPDKDMLQVPVLPAMYYFHPAYWCGSLDFARNSGIGGFLVDWNLRTSLEGLYSAGTSVYGFGHHAFAAATGRYAGRKAAHYALNAKNRPVAKIDRGQVDAERARCYAPVRQGEQGVEWKELNVAITRVMQQYCGMTITEETLKTGLAVLDDLEETEAATATAANPHELGRLLECHSVLATSKLILNASLARKASSAFLTFSRLDFPDSDPSEWRKWLAVRQDNGAVKVRNVPLDFHLNAPNASTYEENYGSHCETSNVALES